MNIAPLASNEELIKKGQSSGFDMRTVAKSAVGIGLLVLLGLGFSKYILPFLVKTVWNLVSLSVGGVILFALLLIITNKNFWKRAGYFIDALAKICFFWLTDFDEFIIQENQIEESEKDGEKAAALTETVEGKKSELANKVSDNIKQRDLAKKKSQLAMQDGDQDAAEDANAEVIACQEYIDTISPIVGDMQKILDFSADMQKKLKRNIKNAKMFLQKSKDTYYSAQVGAKALSSLKRAFLGDSDLNRDADMAMERVRQKTALYIGQMRSSVEILSDISKEQNLNDRAKMSLALDKMQSLSQSTVSDGEIAAPTMPVNQGNFSDIKIPVKGNYDDLLK